MTTKLLRQVAEQDQAELAARYNGEDRKQRPHKIWAAKALKSEMTEPEWAAACRAVRECAPAFDGMQAAFDRDRVDGGGSDYGLAARVTAVRRLEGLRQAAFTRTGASRAPACVEWVVQMWTLEDIARALNVWRKMGRRDPIPDLRPVRPFVRLTLMGMADYYAVCGDELDRWRAL